MPLASKHLPAQSSPSSIAFETSEVKALEGRADTRSQAAKHDKAAAWVQLAMESMEDSTRADRLQACRRLGEGTTETSQGQDQCQVTASLVEAPESGVQEMHGEGCPTNASGIRPGGYASTAPSSRCPLPRAFGWMASRGMSMCIHRTRQRKTGCQG